MTGQAWPSGGILDDDTDPASQEGIFTDDESIFHGHDKTSGDDPRHVQHRDDEATRGQELGPERATGAPGVSPSGGAMVAVPTQQLIAQWDANGQPFVAYTEAGNRIEEWRRPTEQEWALLRERGQIVRGGLTSGVASGAPNGAFGLGATEPSGGASGGMSIGKWVAIAAALAAVAGGGYYLYTRAQDAEDDLEEEAEEE